MSADDPNVVRALADLGVPTEPHQVHEFGPELQRALQALGAGDESRVGIWVDDPDVVRALEALSGPVESNHAYEVGPPIRWPQQVRRANPPRPLPLPQFRTSFAACCRLGLFGGGQAAGLSWQPTAAKEPEA
jgi:hypothetical protein